MPRPLKGQTWLDLFPATERDVGGDCVRWLVDACGCEESDVRPVVEKLLWQFGDIEGWSRAKALPSIYGKRAVPNLKPMTAYGELIDYIGLFDYKIDHNTLWDRCWAARWVELTEAMRVKEWRYSYATPYTGAPVWVWYVDVDGNEIKREFKWPTSTTRC